MGRLCGSRSRAGGGSVPGELAALSRALKGLGHGSATLRGGAA
jgi:hypothetical protein